MATKYKEYHISKSVVNMINALYAKASPSSQTDSSGNYVSLGSTITNTAARATATTSRTSSQVTLAQLWVEAGGNPSVANTMAAIAMAESSGNTQAIDHDANGSTDYGLWQINSVHGYNPTLLLSNPLYNAKAAVAVYNSSGLGAWTTYTSGAYEKYLNNDSSVTVNPGSGVTRPGGESVGSDGQPADTGQGVTDLFTAYETELNTPRTAPQNFASLSSAGWKAPFQWWYQSFTGNYTADTGNT